CTDKYACYTASSMANLTAYACPGNLRKLRNVVERSMVRDLTSQNRLDLLKINPFPTITPAAPMREPLAGPTDFNADMAAYGAALLRRALDESNGNQRRAAERVRLSYYQFRHQIKRHNVKLHASDRIGLPEKKADP
ncbi:MAG: hypothetical protein POG24_09920, partial [Acidocella sp.]|nr:hypothetical protein [Acidocella sp.]